MGRERATAVWSGGGGNQDWQTNAHREDVLAPMGIPAVIKCCLLITRGMAEVLLSSLLPDHCIPGCI